MLTLHIPCGDAAPHGRPGTQAGGDSTILELHRPAPAASSASEAREERSERCPVFHCSLLFASYWSGPVTCCPTAWLRGAIFYVPVAEKNQIRGAGGTCPVYTGCQRILGAPLTCHSGSKPNPGSQKWFSNNRAPRSPLGTYQHAGSQAGESRFNNLPGIPMQGPLGSTDLHRVKCALRHHAAQAGPSHSSADTPHASLGIRPCTELPLDP